MRLRKVKSYIAGSIRLYRQTRPGHQVRPLSAQSRDISEYVLEVPSHRDGYVRGETCGGTALDPEISTEVASANFRRGSGV